MHKLFSDANDIKLEISMAAQMMVCCASETA